MDSATKNAHTRKISRFNLLLSFLSSPAPLFICLPLALLFLSHTSFLPALGENYLRIYTPDSLLSCIIRLIPKFLSFFCIGPLVHFFHFLSPHIFFLLHQQICTLILFSFSSLFPFPSLLLPLPLPFFFTLLWFSSLALKAFDSFPRMGGGGIIEEYTPLETRLTQLRSPSLW